MIEYINQMEDDVAYVDMAIHTIGSGTAEASNARGSKSESELVCLLICVARIKDFLYQGCVGRMVMIWPKN